MFVGRHALALAALVEIAAQIPPPPIVDGPRTPELQMWMPGEARCGGSVERFELLRRPWNALSWSPDAPASVELRFRIDPSGRPLGIVRTSTGFVPNSDDVIPSFAASHFAPGAERRDCTVTYRANRVPLADAPVADLISYTMTPNDGALPKAGWDRIVPPGTSCIAEPRPEPLVRAYPDFRALPATPGVKDWSMIGYDLDRRGRPVRVRLLTGTGNAALDRASAEAVARSRFTPGERTGCLYPYWRAAGTLAPPEMPTEASLRPAGATCPEPLPYARQPTLTYPDAYRRRSIEGWAVIAYDVAPWGEIGNIRVLAAEPSADFGEAAKAVVRNATKAASSTGYVGCVDRVRFRMRPTPQPIVDQAPPPAVY